MTEGTIEIRGPLAATVRAAVAEARIGFTKPRPAGLDAEAEAVEIAPER